MNSRNIEIALSKKHTEDFFITECKNGPTWFGDHLRMDAVAIKKSWTRPLVTVYEVKVSRNDFLRDDKWPQYLAYCNRFYFACPSGLILEKDIDDPCVGLIWVNENGNCITKKSIPSRATDIPASFYKYILFSRIDSERTPFFSVREEYIREYIQHKRSARALAHEFNSAMIKELSDLGEKLKKYEYVSTDIKKYEEIMDLLKVRGLQYLGKEEISSMLDAARKQRNQNRLIENFVQLAKEVAQIEV